MRRSPLLDFVVGLLVAQLAVAVAVVFSVLVSPALLALGGA